MNTLHLLCVYQFCVSVKTSVDFVFETHKATMSVVCTTVHGQSGVADMHCFVPVLRTENSHWSAAEMSVCRFLSRTCSFAGWLQDHLDAAVHSRLGNHCVFVSISPRLDQLHEALQFTNNVHTVSYTCGVGYKLVLLGVMDRSIANLSIATNHNGKWPRLDI